MKKKYLYIVLFIVGLVLIDQVSKLLVVNYLSDKIVLINNFFSLDYVKNTGAAFGFFSGNIFFLVLITLALVIYLIYELKQNIDKKFNLVFIILIISGAIGNLIDRVFRGFVVDFISFILFNSQMPVFNIADIFVTCGVAGLIFVIFKEEKVWKSILLLKKMH